MMAAVLPFTVARFGRAIVMPNLVPPVTQAKDAVAYRGRILAALPAGARFEPLMTCYLTDNTDPDDVEAGFRDAVFAAVKLYPARATTNSQFGVTRWENIRGVLARLEKIGMPLLIHGEEGDPAVDVFDREAVFIDRVLSWMVRDYPALRIVLEHVTTEEGVAFVRGGGANIAATITPHHLIINRNAIFEDGIRPHMYCLPIAKREKHRLALRKAATSGDAHFFLGTDSAPHAVHAKEADCGCAGVFNAAGAIELYAEVFDQEGALDRLEAFASLNGAAFYGREASDDRLALERAPWTVPGDVPVPGLGAVRPFRAGGAVAWRIAAN